MPSTFGSLTGYVFDDALRAETNKQGENYWYAYIEEILDEIGLRAARLDRSDLLEPARLGELRYLFVGDFQLSENESGALRDWVKQGGILIGFQTTGADELFRIKPVKRWAQADTPFTISAYYRFRQPDGDANPLYDYNAALLPILSSEVVLLEKNEEEAIGSLLQVAYRSDTGCEAIVHQALGEGSTYYFGFNLPHTIWAIQQGRPVDRDYDGDGLYRYNDAVLLSRSVGLETTPADYWLLYLEAILSRHPQPFIHQLPPLEDGTVPDALYHIGGDDECTPGIQVPSSDYFREKGLPYQINLMPDRQGNFAIGKEEYEHLKRNGHDPSLHFDFVGQYSHYTEEDMKKQLDLYVEAFGELPIATVNHCSMATGWAEQARWASGMGMKGDNTRVHAFVPPDNGINLVGFGFGTAFPHFVYDDYRHDNRRLDYVNIPIIFFEPRIYEETRERDIQQIRTLLDRAAHFGWTLNLFIHPIYVVSPKHTPYCKPAIDEIIRYTEEKGYKVVLHSTNQVCRWWFDRSATKVAITDPPAGKDRTRETILEFEVQTERSEGVLLKLPVQRNGESAPAVTVDGTKRETILKRQSGVTWAFCHVTKGSHLVHVAYS